MHFRVSGHARLSDEQVDAILNQSPFVLIPPKRMSRLWNGTVPHREKLSIEVAQTAVCMMDDWVTVIFGKTMLDCVRALSVLLSSLVEALASPVTIHVMSPATPAASPSLDLVMRTERRRALFWATLRYIGTLGLGALAALAAQLLWTEVIK